MADLPGGLVPNGVPTADGGAKSGAKAGGEVPNPYPSGGGGGNAVIYRMRGFDQNVSVNGYVFWDATGVDGNAAEYTGSAGPVVDVILFQAVGA